MEDAQVPGAFYSYSRALSFFQWLVNGTPNRTHKWIPILYGSARVLQADYEMMKQIITFRDPTPNDVPMISGQARPDNEIRTQMSLAKYAFTNVDGTFGVFPPGKTRGR
jgi:hypothetical protein